MCVNQIGNLWIGFDGSNNFPALVDKNFKNIGKDKMGFGWAIEVSPNNGGPVGSLYWGGAANTFFNIDRKRGRAVMVLSNVFPFGTKYGESVYFKAEELIYKE